mmetsp:Transcript_32832/g.83062  ORF Transcript_32832/g.83062 Transcript_32832/m.83062 type:complete len:748 (+) Transcript_32832:108-2351(+)
MPRPPPQHSASELSSGRSGAFAELLRRLDEQHLAEVRTLRSTIGELQCKLGMSLQDFPGPLSHRACEFQDTSGQLSEEGASGTLLDSRSCKKGLGAPGDREITEDTSGPLSEDVPPCTLWLNTLRTHDDRGIAVESRGLLQDEDASGTSWGANPHGGPEDDDRGPRGAAEADDGYDRKLLGVEGGPGGGSPRLTMKDLAAIITSGIGELRGRMDSLEEALCSTENGVEALEAELQVELESDKLLPSSDEPAENMFITGSCASLTEEGDAAPELLGGQRSPGEEAAHCEDLEKDAGVKPPARRSASSLPHRAGFAARLRQLRFGPPEPRDQLEKKRRHRRDTGACGRLTPLLEGLMTGVIFVNIAFLILRLEYESHRIAATFGLDEHEDVHAIEVICDVLQHMFCLVFLVELIVRVAIQRRHFFYTKRLELFNIFDACIVLSAGVELYILEHVQSGVGFDLTVLRGFRILRVFRISRFLDGISQLRLLLATVIASFHSLFWSMMLLVLTLLMASLIMNQLVVFSMQASPLDAKTLEWTYRYYGTPAKSFYTFFELTFSGGWPNYARKLVEDVNPLFALFWAVYVSCIIFAMTRIISALFLKETLQTAQKDAEMQTARKLANVFSAADTSGDGRITMQEFTKLLQKSHVKTYLEKLGLEADDPEQLFKLMDDGDGQLTNEEFLENAAKMKGEAKSQDMKCMIQEMRDMASTVKNMKNELDEAHGRPPMQPPAQQPVQPPSLARSHPGTA